MELLIEPYQKAIYEWPQQGEVILAQFDDDGIWVYQSFKTEIALYAVENQRFEGCPVYNETRMTWIKTNFLWMQYRNGWCSKHNQERCLAIKLKRLYFDRLVEAAIKREGNIRFQWDPDHTPEGGNCRRRALQLGIRKKWSRGLATGADVLQIIDITDFIKSQKMNISKEKKHLLMVPIERPYNIHV